MDLLLTDNGDGGEFVLEGGDVKEDGTFSTALYVSLFGGDNYYNVFEEYQSDNSFEEALNQPITALNLQNVERTAKKLLDWFLQEGLASDITVKASGNINEKINVQITITEPDETSSSYAVI